jgi:hypothetical protein
MSMTKIAGSGAGLGAGPGFGSKVSQADCCEGTHTLESSFVTFELLIYGMHLFFHLFASQPPSRSSDHKTGGITRQV